MTFWTGPRADVLSCSELAVILKEIYTENKDESLRDRIKRCLDIADGQEKFVEETCSAESDFQKRISKDTLNDPLSCKTSRMMSGHVIGQLVKMVSEIAKAKRILEIGMFTGYGVVTLGETEHCEEIISLDTNKSMESFVLDRIKGTSLENKLRIIIGPATESLMTLKNEGKNFDLIFIDADKTGYRKYYEYIMDNGLLNEGGVFICDNIFWHNDTYLDKKTDAGQALNDFVQFVKNDHRVDQILIPLRDGIMLIKAKFE